MKNSLKTEQWAYQFFHCFSCQNYPLYFMLEKTTLCSYFNYIYRAFVQLSKDKPIKLLIKGR